MATRATRRERAARAPEIWLVAIGASQPHKYAIAEGQVSIGSDRGNDLIISDSTVSRLHAIIRRERGEYTVADLESTNGTFINGNQIRMRATLKSGDEVRFGATRFAVVSGRRVADGGGRRLSRAAAIGGLIAACMVGFIAMRYFAANRRATIPAAAPIAAPPAIASTGAKPQHTPPASPAAARPGIPRKNSADGESARAAVVRPEAIASNPESATIPYAGAVNNRLTVLAKIAPEAGSEAPSEGAVGTAERSGPPWLQKLNEFRAMASLPPVGEDSALSRGDYNHAVYLIKNYAQMMLKGGDPGANAHAEDPSNPWYTPEGAAAARDSDVADRGAPPGMKLSDPQTWAIEGWIAAPFHRLYMLNPLLRRVGFGSYCENNACAAVLNVLGGVDPLAPAADLPHAPIEFPPDGDSIARDLRALDTEWPDPVAGCAGYALPVGIPATLQLGPGVRPQLTSFSITGGNGSKIEACGFDAASYRNPDPVSRERAADILRGQGAVVIVPRTALEPGGRYTIDAIVSGRDYKWSFMVAR